MIRLLTSFLRALSSNSQLHRRQRRKQSHRAPRIEALESRAMLATLNVDTLEDTNDNTLGDGTCADSAGNCSLRSAIQEANALGGSHTINLSAGTYKLTLQGIGEDLAVTGDLDITADITLVGSGSASTVIDGIRADRLFEVLVGGQLSLSDLTLRNGDAVDVQGDGGAIRNAGVLSISDSILTSNFAPDEGGAIYASGSATTTISNSKLTYNRGEDLAGAVFTEAGTTLDINKSDISHNSGGFGGFDAAGAMQISGMATINNSTITHNYGQGDGGAIRLLGGDLTIDNSTLSHNVAEAAGGAIEVEGGLLTIRDSILDSNVTLNALGDGGAIALDDLGGVRGNLILERSSVTNNYSASQGGGIYILDSDVTIQDSNISGNSGDERGGGITASFGSATTIQRTTISNNRSVSSVISSGGGLNVFGGTSLVLENSTISGNVTSADGGGVYIFASSPTTLRLTNNTIVNNTAENGGGITTFDDIEVQNNIVANNFAVTDDPDFRTIGATILSRGGNLIEDATDVQANLVGSDITGIDPQLLPLGNYGGLNPTHFPRATSPAINSGRNPGSPTTDQRGAARPQSFVVDIGAVEAGTSLTTLDFGDAPDSYGTLLASDGPRHLAAGPRLGAAPDTEHDAQPLLDGRGDGLDEDGVTLSTITVGDTLGTVAVNSQNASGGARLDGWIDFNRDGDFDDAGDQIFSSFDVGTGNGIQNLNFAIPATAVAGPTFARFRISTIGGLNPTGPAADGEVEDHLLIIEPTSPGGFDVNSLADTVDLVPGDGICVDAFGSCTLRAAIQEANALGGPQTIRLPAGVFQLDLDGTGEDLAATGDLDVTADITIIGAGAGATIIDGGFIDRVFDVLVAGQLTLSGVTIRNGFLLSTDGDGAGIRSLGTLSVTDSNIEFNYSENDGGAIFAGGTALTTIQNSNLSFNYGDDHAGALFTEAGTTTNISSSIISHNVGGFGGFDAGGAMMIEGMVTIADSEISRNFGFGDGGAIRVLGGMLTVDNSNFSYNTTEAAGGAIEIEGGSATIRDSVFDSNVTLNALGDGGAITVEQMSGGIRGNLTLERSRVTNNYSSSQGGGIYVLDADAMIRDTTVSGNSADERGGGMTAGSGSDITIERTTFSNNRSVSTTISSGGGLNFFGARPSCCRIRHLAAMQRQRMAEECISRLRAQ